MTDSETESEFSENEEEIVKKAKRKKQETQVKSEKSSEKSINVGTLNVISTQEKDSNKMIGDVTNFVNPPNESVNLESSIDLAWSLKSKTKETQQENELKAEKKIFVKCSHSKDQKRLWDKHYFCVYCAKPYAKLPRHFEDRHKSEAEVEKLIQLSYRKDDSPETRKFKQKARDEIIDGLRRKGNFNHNVDVIQRGYGEIIVKRCPTKETFYKDFLPCEYCLEFYYRKDLHRHVKTCKHCKTTSGKYNRVQSRASMLLPVHASISNELQKIFERMKVDETSLSLKLDLTIIKYGNVLCRKHYKNQDQTYHISNKLRELGRLLVYMQNLKIVKSFEEIINPQLFPDVVKCVTELCGWDETTKTIETPSLGIKLGQLLVKIACMIKGEAIISGNIVQRTAADDFSSLLSMRWNDEVAKVSRTELECRKWNKPQLLPLTEDLQLIKNHLVQTKKESIAALAANNSDVRAWRNLCSSTLAHLILLNRRRTGEASKLMLKHVEEMSSGSEMNDEIRKSLSPFEIQLCNTFKRVEVRGKRGRKVPMLLNKELTSAIQLLINTREAVGVNENNIYVFAIPTGNSLQFIRGNDALRKHAKLCELKCPQAITSTKLRKHIATLSQILNLEERELDILANFLGHDVRIHREYYRLPEHTTQIAKCGKLLLMMEQGKVGEFSGKQLKDIEIDINGKDTYSSTFKEQLLL